MFSRRKHGVKVYSAHSTRFLQLFTNPTFFQNVDRTTHFPNLIVHSPHEKRTENPLFRSEQFIYTSPLEPTIDPIDDNLTMRNEESPSSDLIFITSLASSTFRESPIWVRPFSFRVTHAQFILGGFRRRN